MSRYMLRVLNDVQEHFSKTTICSIYEMPKTAIELLPIEELNLSVRSYKLLKNVRIDTIQNLLQTDLNHIKSLGQKSIKNIYKAIQKLEESKKK